jgi:ribosomal protein L16/L10AE
MKTEIINSGNSAPAEMPKSVQEISGSSQGEIESAKFLVKKVMEREETFMDRYFPTKDVKIKKQKNAELVDIHLSDRNELYKMCGQVMKKNFAETANVFLSDQMVSGKVYLTQRLTEGITQAADKFEVEQAKLMEILQQKADTVMNWGGSLKEKFMGRLEKDVDMYLDAYESVKFSLMKDLQAVKDALIKA